MLAFEQRGEVGGEATGGHVDADDGDLAFGEALGDLGGERGNALPDLLARQEERRCHYSIPASCFA